MADFTPEPTHYVLTFDELPAKGLELTVRAGTVRERLAFDSLRFSDAADLDAVLKRESDVLAVLATRLVSWNMATPPNLDALLDLEDPLIKQIIDAWIAVITNGGDDLGKESTSGPDPREASLPMESLSPNPSS
jgi:hypothetical protein